VLRASLPPRLFRSSRPALRTLLSSCCLLLLRPDSTLLLLQFPPAIFITLRPLVLPGPGALLKLIWQQGPGLVASGPRASRPGALALGPGPWALAFLAPQLFA
jgi:hypothetical protein